MRFFLILTLISLVLSQPPPNHQLVRCIFIDTSTGSYSCRIIDAVILSNLLPVQFYADNHLEGRNDSHVTHVLTTRAAPTYIRMFTKAMLHNYVNLQHMQIEFAQLEDIHEEAFEKCDRLERFEADENPGLGELPLGPIFKNCVNLRHLSFMNCGLSSIPSRITEGLINLDILRFTGNYLTTLDANLLSHTPNLRSLSFASNPLREIPSLMFRNLPQLEILELFNANIGNLDPQWFVELPNLRTLSLSSNLLTNIPSNILQNQQKLEVLFLASNQLERLNSLGRLNSLAHLVVNNNQMNAIEPNFFDELPHLDIFEAHGNICVNQRIENVSNIDLEANAIFNQCFGNWHERPTTPSTTTTTESGGERVNMMVWVIGIFICATRVL